MKKVTGAWKTEERVKKHKGGKSIMATQTLTAVIHKEDDWFVADCPEIGTVSQGNTLEEAIANLKEATELYIEETNCRATGRSMITTFEAVVNA
jgi:predicted RNase H-like HicB family nuclease